MIDRVIRHIKHDTQLAVLAGGDLAVLLVMALILGGRFYSANNMQSMATQVAEFGLLAVGMSLAMLTGGIDLSIVSMSVLAGIVGAEFLTGNIVDLETTPTGLVMVLAVGSMLITGLLCGLLNGLLIAKASITPILATLATSIFFTGISTVMTGGASLPVRVKEYFTLGILTFAGIPLVFLIMVVVFVVVGLVLNKTRFGRRTYLYGANSIALRFSGARHERLVIAVYVVIGLICSLAAIIMVSRTASARVGYGEAYLLQAILVVVLAGFDPFGGRGRLIGLALGLVMLQSLSSAFTILRFGPFMKVFIWGAMLLAVMLVTRILSHPGKPSAPDPAANRETAVPVTPKVG